MSAPVKPFLGLVAAFVGGIAVTVAFVGRSEKAPEPDAAPKPAKVAALETRPRPSGTPSEAGVAAPSGTDRWVDPVKQSAQAPASRGPLPPLVFHLDQKSEHAKTAALQEVEQLGSEPAQHSIAAQISPPPRPSATELQAKPDAASRPILAAKPIDRIPASKPSDDLAARKAQASRLTAGLSHKSEAARVATNDDAEDAASPAIARQVRRVYVPSRSNGDPAEQPYGRRYVELSGRSDRDPEDQPKPYRREATSGQPGGIMRWLVER